MLSSMRSPSVVHRSLAVPRAGSEEAEYEDAVATAADDWPVCAAVADGATESVFARSWAEHLARGLVDRRATAPEVLREAVADGQKAWQPTVRDRAEEEPWYVSAKAAEGAFAALLGLSLYTDGQWRAASVGDCCLFHLREGGLLQSWPFETPDAFTNRPALVPSRSDQTVPAPETATGTWQPQDLFLLATDAVAAWLLRADASEDEGVQTRLSGVADWDEDTFRQIVDTARNEGGLRNDDTTLLVIHVEPGADKNDGTAAK